MQYFRGGGYGTPKMHFKRGLKRSFGEKANKQRLLQEMKYAFFLRQHFSLKRVKSLGKCLAFRTLPPFLTTSPRLKRWVPQKGREEFHYFFYLANCPLSPAFDRSWRVLISPLPRFGIKESLFDTFSCKSWGSLHQNGSQKVLGIELCRNYRTMLWKIWTG